MRLVKILLVSVIFASAATAGPFDRFLSRCTQLLERPYQKFLESNGEEALLLKIKPGHHGYLGLFTEKQEGYLGLYLEKRLGAGIFGQVLTVTHLTDPEIETQLRTHNGKLFDDELVVKIPHALRKINMGYPIKYSHSASVNEYKIYKLLNEKAFEISLHSKAPKNPAWKPGTLPVAPILGAVTTERGLLMFKPAIKGHDLKAIALRLKNGTPEQLAEIKNGLRDYYDFLQAVYGTVKIGWFKRGFSGDGRGPNLVWLDNKTEQEIKQLGFLNYTRPGFITYELAKVPFNKPHYIEGKGLSYEEFEAEFFSYLKE